MKKYNGEKAIISLTSWKARINTVSKTLFSLVKNCPGFHIVLCLSEEEFPLKEKELPENLMAFADNDMIEILWCEEDLKPHTKYFYTMQKYRECPIILADDDLIYTENMAEFLYEKWVENKNSIIASRCHLMKIENMKILPYDDWEWETKQEKNSKLFFTSGMGTLFPPNCFSLTDEDKSKIHDFITQDDVYLNALSRINHVEIINTHHKMFIVHSGDYTQKTALSKVNVKMNYNDVLIDKVKSVFL